MFTTVHIVGVADHSAVVADHIVVVDNHIVVVDVGVATGFFVLTVRHHFVDSPDARPM